MNATLRASATALLLLTPGCLAQSHELLSVRSDGGGSGTVDESVPYTTDCEEALAVARHSEPCRFQEAFCVGIGAPQDAVDCVDGRWIRTHCKTLDPTDGDCADDLYLSPDSLVTCAERVASSGGCMDLDIRVSDRPVIRRRLCEVDPLPGVRPDAVGATPWTACADAIASGASGDPCDGDFACIGQRASSVAGTVLTWCDTGILRMVVATPNQYESECEP